LNRVAATAVRGVLATRSGRLFANSARSASVRPWSSAESSRARDRPSARRPYRRASRFCGDTRELHRLRDSPRRQILSHWRALPDQEALHRRPGGS
jgi:hypothetical protein